MNSLNVHSSHARDLALMRTQRARLASLCAVVDAADKWVPNGWPKSWNSKAQREYAVRLDALRGCFHSAALRLDRALDRLDTVIAEAEGSVGE